MAKAMSIEDEVFEDMRAEFDAVLQDTIGKMCSKGTAEGKVALNVNIALEEGAFPDGDGRFTKVLLPTFKYDVGSLVQSKVKLSGKIEGYGAITRDEDDGGWKLTKYEDDQMEF